MTDLHARIEHNMTNQVLTVDGARRIEALRDKAKEFAHEVAELCPPGREQSLALTDIESALMWSVAAVAREGGPS